MLTRSPRSFLTFRTDFHSGPSSRPRTPASPRASPGLRPGLSGFLLVRRQGLPRTSGLGLRTLPAGGRQVEGRSSHASPRRTLGRHVSPPPGLCSLATTWAGRLFRPVGRARCVSTPPLGQVRSEGPPRPPQTFPVGTAADRGGALRSRCLFLSTSQPSRGAVHTCGHSGLERRPQPRPCSRRPETLPAAQDDGKRGSRAGPRLRRRSPPQGAPVGACVGARLSVEKVPRRRGRCDIK